MQCPGEQEAQGDSSGGGPVPADELQDPGRITSSQSCSGLVCKMVTGSQQETFSH